MIPSKDTEVNRKFAGCKLLAMDVDGVLTDGGITILSSGVEARTFNVQDGLGLVLLKLIGVQTAWVSGRSSEVVKQRSEELKIDFLLQKVKHKAEAILELCVAHSISPDQVVFIGDDWNDLPAFSVCGVSIAVANASRDVRRRADFTTTEIGGQGAVREVIDLLLDLKRSPGREEVIEMYLESLATYPSNLEHSGAGQ